jgi:hypothetical protein
MNDATYFAYREKAERALAERAAEPSVRDIHLEMAARYADLVQLHLAQEKLAEIHNGERAATSA